MPGHVPAGFIVQVSDIVYTLSPTAALAWSCSRLTRAEALRLIHEFCGSFAVDLGVDRGFIGCSPLLSLAELSTYCMSANGMRGATRVLSHLPFAVENCASPLESAMVTLLCLPIHDGGYKLNLPTMNSVILPKGTAQQLTDRTYYVGDAVWESSGVILEYDSRSEHSSPNAMAHDNIRKMALEAQGYHVTSVTSGILFNDNLFHRVALDTSRRIGCRLRPEYFDKSWEAKRQSARRELLDVPLRWRR